MGKRLRDQKKVEMKNTVDKCDLCGGELKPGQTTLEICRNEELVVIREVPADVCQQCQEAYLSVSVSERLDRFLNEYQQHRPERYLAVPQFAALQVIGG
jgi:YgiT-type zinc finger domain-containing protein